MDTLLFLQHYWWFLISLLGALLVFLLFVQGGQGLLYTMGRTEAERDLVVNALGRKWEFTFTTLVTFGGAFFASFPLFYSTSFGGAFYVWMAILLVFVVQAVSYEYRRKPVSYTHLDVYKRQRWYRCPHCRRIHTGTPRCPACRRNEDSEILGQPNTTYNPINTVIMEKIALPTRNGAVDDHFGHCECYTIFTLDADRRIAGRQTLPAAEGCGCKSDIAPRLHACLLYTSRCV